MPSCTTLKTTRGRRLLTTHLLITTASQNTKWSFFFVSSVAAYFIGRYQESRLVRGKTLTFRFLIYNRKNLLAISDTIFLGDSEELATNLECS